MKHYDLTVNNYFKIVHRSKGNSFKGKNRPSKMKDSQDFLANQISRRNTQKPEASSF